MLKRVTAVLIALVVGAAVIYGGVSLYKVRHELFRPDLKKAGGTEVVFDVEPGPGEEEMEQACRVLRKRFDDSGAGGVEVRHDGTKRLAIMVPNSRYHDALVGQARRLAFEKGAVELRLLANVVADPDALAAAEKEFMAMKGPPIKPGERRGGEVTVGAGVEKKRYHWFRLNDGQAREWLRMGGIHATVRAGGAGRWVEFTAYRNTKLFAMEPPGGISPSYFVLCAEPGELDRVGGEGIERVRIAGKDARQIARLEFAFEEGAMQRLRRLTNGAGRPARTEEMSSLACIVDGEVVFAHDLFSPLLRKQTFYVYALPSEVDDLAALIRGGELPVSLDRASVRENPVAPSR
jgi:preprotein translocase subunit SecD